MEPDTTLQVSSNLMLVSKLRPNEDPFKYIPGDYVWQIYEWLKDRRAAQYYFTPEQLMEREQYLVCRRCCRPCAGTCEG